MTNQNQGANPNNPAVMPAQITVLLRVLMIGGLPFAEARGWVSRSDGLAVIEVALTAIAAVWSLYRNLRTKVHINIAANHAASAPRPNVPL